MSSRGRAAQAVASRGKLVRLDAAANPPDGSPCLAEVAMTPDLDRPERSIVVPCHNEDANVVAMYEAVTPEAENHAASPESIFIDYKSSDRTLEFLRELGVHTPGVRAFL